MTEVVVVAPPELDAATAPAFRDEVAVYLSLGAPVIVADLARTTFVDSTGIGALIGLTKRAGDLGVELRIRGTSDAVHRTLRLSGASNVLTIDPRPR